MAREARVSRWAAIEASAGKIGCAPPQILSNRTRKAAPPSACFAATFPKTSPTYGRQNLSLAGNALHLLP